MANRRARIYPRRYLKWATRGIGNGLEPGWETRNDVQGTTCTVLPTALDRIFGIGARINPRPTQGVTHRRLLWINFGRSNESTMDERHSTNAAALPGIVGRI